MAVTTTAPPSRKITTEPVLAGASAAAQLLLTSGHHLYGAWRFDTPWRAHVAHLALWIAIALGVALASWWRGCGGTRRLAAWLFAGLSFAACCLWLGLFEGGYNHALKAAVGSAGVGSQTFELLFPPGIYEPPGDVVFEATGILQLPAGLLAGYFAWRFLKASRESN